MVFNINIINPLIHSKIHLIAEQYNAITFFEQWKRMAIRWQSHEREIIFFYCQSNGFGRKCCCSNLVLHMLIVNNRINQFRIGIIIMYLQWNRFNLSICAKRPLRICFCRWQLFWLVWSKVENYRLTRYSSL